MNNSRLLKIAALAVMIFAAAWPAPTAAAAAETGRAECLSMKSKILGKQVRYCTLLPPSYDTDKTRVFPILYFFHGLGDNEQSFVRSGGMNLTTDLWERHQLSEFLIVTPAAEASFYINSHDGHSRYEDFLLREFIPFIEHRYRIAGDRLERGVGGISMGGFGALRLAFVHPELFGSVTGQSAALIENAPQFVPDESQRSSRVDLLAAVFGSPPDRAFWDRNNPLKIARTANLGALKIYFDCGSEDDFGFYTGAATLDKILTARHIAHEFHIYPGRHDWTYFAAHLPAVLEFHAQSFAAAAHAVK
jgi:S-formylglutathione hydrolase FrmB